MKLTAETVASLPRTVLGCAGRMIFHSASLVVSARFYLASITGVPFDQNYCCSVGVPVGDDRCSRYGRIFSTRRNSRICQGSYWFGTFAMRFYQYGVSAESFCQIGGVLDRIRKSTVAGFLQITNHRIRLRRITVVDRNCVFRIDECARRSRPLLLLTDVGMKFVRCACTKEEAGSEKVEAFHVEALEMIGSIHSTSS